MEPGLFPRPPPLIRPHNTACNHTCLCIHPSIHPSIHQANVIMGLAPGEVFTQRNVGNQATHR